MSAAETQTQDTTSAANTVAGPTEIFVAGQNTADTNTVNVEVKEVKPNEKPAEKADDAGKADGAAESGEETRTEKTKPNGLQNRIDELTRARRAAEREVEYWKARANPGDDTAQNPAQPAVAKPPVRENFESDEAFEDARIDYRVSQRIATEKAEEATKTHKETSEALAKEQATAWQAHLSSVKETIPDFDEVVDNSDLKVLPHVAQLMMDHDRGGELMYHFAKNPEALEELNGMTATKAAFKIHDIATSIHAPEKPAVLEKPTTKAPAPVRPLGSGRSTVTQLADMPMDDYVAQRRKQGASWAR